VHQAKLDSSRSFQDAGASGKSLKGREGLNAALRAVETGEASAVVASKLDRLSRSLADFANLMASAQTGGWNLVALDLGIDLSTAAGEFMANVMASAAQWERRIIGQRTREALAIVRSQGVRLGRPRQLDETIRGRIIEASKSGKGWSAIASALNDDNIPTAHNGLRWHASTVRTIVLASQATPEAA